MFPGIIMLLNVGSAVVYAMNGDVRRTIYWLAALVLTATVTF